jgi:long-chain acyl-CoA synthetase/crotonobetaine/carnitine-CoA ligase
MSIDPGQIEMEAMRGRVEALEFPENIGVLIKNCAEKFGDRIAANWFDAGITLTYDQLHQRSDKIAAGLLKRGFRKGAHIAVMLPNGPEFILIWFAIAKLGMVMVPVNTAYKGSELDFVLNQSDAQALFIHADFMEEFARMVRRPALLSDERVFEISSLASLEQLEEPVGGLQPGYEIASSDLMSIQYTSGTTGFPKGCMLTHDYWVVLSHNGASLFESYDISRFLFWAPMFYMDGQWLFLASMINGGTAFLPSKMSLSKFFNWIWQYEIEYTVLPEPVMSAHPTDEKDAEIPLKLVSAFGWRPAARAEAEKRFNLVARDSFGMTEVGAALICPKDAGDKLLTNTCGLAAPFRQTRVVNEDGNEVAPGTSGELQIRGRSILLGYYKRPDANATSFDGDWFRSGDLFIKDKDGYHRIVGRLKEMIKRAGENISANEVEAVLREMPQIEEAAAIAVPDELRREEVLVLIKLAAGSDPQDCPPRDLITHCKKQLAAFKVPRYITYVEEFPRTATRKIAKTKLDMKTCIEPVFDSQDECYLSIEEAVSLF